MDPVNALERIAVTLERERGDRYRIQAFRRAADVVRRVPPDVLDDLHRRGRLRDLPGIGATTADVIANALDGQTPGYLDAVEARAEAAAAAVEPGPGAELLGRQAGDCHLHTEWSDGSVPVEAMARAAHDLGHDWIVVTDHSPRLEIAHGLSVERLERQLDEIAGVNERLAPFRVLSGVEVDIVEEGALDHADEVLARLDLVVASVHSRLGDDEVAMTRRLVRAVEHPHVDVLGHCTGRLIEGRGRAESRFDVDAVLAAVVDHGKALEVNCRPERLDPPRRILRRAAELGCFVAIDSDAHAPGQLAWQAYGCDRVVECEVPEAQVVTTWDAATLLSWAATHA